MISVRGINVFPEMIAEVLSDIEGIGPEYSLEIKRKAGMNDQLIIRVNASPEIINATDSKKTALQEKIQFALRRTLGLRVKMEMVPRDN